MNIIKTINEFSTSFKIDGYQYESWIVHQFHGFSFHTGDFRSGGCAYRCDLESCTKLSDPKVFRVYGGPLPQDIIDELKSQIEESARYYLSIPKPLPPAEFPKITFSLHGLKFFEEKKAERRKEKELNTYIPDPSKNAMYNAIGKKLFNVDELPDGIFIRATRDLLFAPVILTKRGEIPEIDESVIDNENKINNFILENMRANNDFSAFVYFGSMKHIKAQLQSVDLENGEHEISFTDYYPWNEFYDLKDLEY
jgi:hypothetical protein